jgi:hypothetical protein
MASAVGAVGWPDTAAAASAIVITGGDSSADVVCGNVALAQQQAQRRGARLQRNNCTAQATGGNVTLSDVNIYLSSAAASRAITELTDSRSRQTRANCDVAGRVPGGGIQVNHCWGTARGGPIGLENVSQVTHGRDGRTTTRRIASESSPPRRAPQTQASCANVVAVGVDQRDDCTGRADGASWGVRGVDVERLGSDGSRTMQRGVDVILRGGTANASISCYNTTDSSGRVFQVNRCSAQADGGAVVLHNVTFHISA